MAPVAGSSSTRRASFSSVAPEAVARAGRARRRARGDAQRRRPRAGTSGTATASAPSASRWLGRARPAGVGHALPGAGATGGEDHEAAARARRGCSTTPTPRRAGAAPAPPPPRRRARARARSASSREGPLVLPLGDDVRPVGLRDARRGAPRVLVPQQQLSPRLLDAVLREARRVAQAPERLGLHEPPRGRPRQDLLAGARERPVLPVRGQVAALLGEGRLRTAARRPRRGPAPSR